MIKIFNGSEFKNFIKIKSDKKVSNFNDGLNSAVADIINNVKINGDSALLDYELKFDKVNLSALEVSQDEINAALKQVEPEFLNILNKAANNIKKFHARQIRNNFIIAEDDGIITGQKFTPIENVGIYVPGGTAAYPSTVLMDAVPAKIAGCKNIIMVTPPRSDGTVNPNILVAAHVAGVDRIFKIGGAQAVAALAYGTESVPKVDKIVGPGNIYVAEAKRQVFGIVAIDMIAGPSEILIIADENNENNEKNFKLIAADLLAQAEHDKMASSILVTTSEKLAYQVQAEIENQLKKLARYDIARESIDNNGMIILAENLDEALNIANEIAPEHLELCVDKPFELLNKVKNAGSIFLGRNTPEALGDYYAGPNHTLPTSGTARFSSPLSVDDFIKKSQFIYYSSDAMSAAADDVAAFAFKEGLTGHAASALMRKRGVE